MTLVARNDPRTGRRDEPVAAGGQPQGRLKPWTLPSGARDLAGVMKYDLPDVRDALERASARHTAVIVAAGAVAKALLAEIGVAVAGDTLEVGGARGEKAIREAIDAARQDKDTLGGIVEVRARGVPPGLAPTRRRRNGSTRGAWALLGTQAVKGVEIGDGFGQVPAARSRTIEIFRRERGFTARRTTPAVSAGISNGEEIVVRAAMKPLPTLMKPLRSVDLETHEPAEALVERSDVSAVEALAVVAEACVAFELARAAREKFGGDSVGDFVAAYRAYVERIDWVPR
jgi:chorismate synthase